MSDGASLRREANQGCAIFVHAGAGFHSHVNEKIHLSACNDAAKVAMAILNAGGSAVDAVEMAIRVLEDREITNAGYGSNLAMDGVVECDASIIDGYGRSGAVGAVAQIKNPICLARLVLEHTTTPLSLRRVPPNFLVAQGATDFAYENGIPVLPHDALVSKSARERWLRWKSDLKYAERKAEKARQAKLGDSSSISAANAEPHLEQTGIELAADEAERERIRRRHTRDMGMGLFEEMEKKNKRSLSSSSPPASMPGSYHSTPPAATPQSEGSPVPSMTPKGPSGGAYVGSVHEASRNAFINSTQTIPTLAGLAASKHNGDGDGGHSEYEMLDVADPASNLNDDASISDSESSDSTLELPSLTPSPPPAAETSATMMDLEPPRPVEQDSNAHNTSDEAPPEVPSYGKQDDHITDTVGAIAVDADGNIACGASSGGIGMKYRGRVGPAALVGIGAHVIPIQLDDKQKKTVAVVTSGTGEHMATTMAAAVCAERVYHGVARCRGGTYEVVEEDEALRRMVQLDFMEHPSVRNSNSAGAIGILCVKKSQNDIRLFYAHNTDSFALASQLSSDPEPVCTMSRSRGKSSFCQGGRAFRIPRRRR